MGKYLIVILFLISACKERSESHDIDQTPQTVASMITYAKGFTVEKTRTGVTILRISSPWPDAESIFTYALVPKTLKDPQINLENFDAVIPVPVNNLVVTSTTHIPALEALGVENRLIGFPETKYVSSKATRRLIDAGKVRELGSNESINTEQIIELKPEVVIGFSISSQNKIYATLEQAQIPVVYNGDWTEESPLGKAEWVKFFAPFFMLENKADTIFKEISDAYKEAKLIAEKSHIRPTVLSGALYKDVWYVPGGKSWAAQFIRDANAHYLWEDNEKSGSLSLSIETILSEATEADYWISPSQFSSYVQMEQANRHYSQFSAFKNKSIYTFAKTKGTTGGLLYYELGPNRPDLVLKDLIHIFHPDVLPDHEPFFFKPLE